MLDLERPAGRPLEEWLGMDDFRRWLLDSRVGEVPISISVAWTPRIPGFHVAPLMEGSDSISCLKLAVD